MKESELTKGEKMHEAEVALRLAFYLLDLSNGQSHANISLDGMHHHAFPIPTFLHEKGWHRENSQGAFCGSYTRKDKTLTIKSVQGFDVQVTCDGRNIKAECKGGALGAIKGKGPTIILAEAIGQAIASGLATPEEELWVAVPDSPKFENAGARIIRSPVFARTGIKIALVGKNGVRLLRNV
jgi:hypothetical protein